MTSQNNLQKFSTSLDIPITYIHLNKGENKPLIVIFHGFADSAKSVLRRVYPATNDEFEVLAINGPFPVPQKKGEEWKHAYAWYFADFTTRTIYIHPQVAVKAVNDVLTELNLHERRKFLVGFSQGGFFIPHLMSNLKNVEHIVTIGAAYRSEEYDKPLNVPLDALHGAQDDIISLATARESFLHLKFKNPKGNFIEFANMGHTLNDQGRLWLKNKIDEVFKI